MIYLENKDKELLAFSNLSEIAGTPYEGLDIIMDSSKVDDECHELFMLNISSGLIPSKTPQGDVAFSPRKYTIEDERLMTEKARLVAYSHPVTGSDRYKNEAEAEKLSGNTIKAKEIELKWVARRAEIAADIPWPLV